MLVAVLRWLGKYFRSKKGVYLYPRSRKYASTQTQEEKALQKGNLRTCNRGGFMPGLCNDIDELIPILALRVKNFVTLCKSKNFGVKVVETYRRPIVQKAYFAQGRENLEIVNKYRAEAGLLPISSIDNAKKITNDPIGKHTTREAVDFCPTKPDGSFWWNAPQEVWEQMGLYAEQCGLDWCAGGRGNTWAKGWDNPHCELLKDWVN